MDFEALWLTLRLAAGTTAILLVVALPLAWWIASGRGAGRAVVQALVALPLVLPPTVLGFYLLVMLGPLTAPGRMLTRVFGHSLAFSFSGLLVGSVLYSLPFAVQPLVAGFGSVNPGFIEASAGLGASPWRTFRSVVMPLTRGSLLTSVVLAFTHTGRQHSRSHADTLHLAVRPGAGLQLQRSQSHGAGAGGGLAGLPHRHLFAARKRPGAG